MNLCSSVRITHATSVTLYAYRYATDPADFLHFASMFNQLADAIFRPHCSHAVLRRDLFLHVSTFRSLRLCLSVCVFVTTVSAAK